MSLHQHGLRLVAVEEQGDVLQGHPESYLRPLPVELGHGEVGQRVGYELGVICVIQTEAGGNWTFWSNSYSQLNNLEEIENIVEITDKLYRIKIDK